MGSWYETCKLTNLPVRNRDPVVWMAVVEGEYTDSKFVESTGFYAPMSFPIYGEYADYGSIDNISNPNCVEFFKKYIEDGMSNNRIIYDNDEPFDINLVLDYVERGYLKVGCDPEDARELSYIFMHRHAYDKLVALHGSRHPYESPMTTADECTKFFSYRLAQRSETSHMTEIDRILAMSDERYRIGVFGDVYLNMLIADSFYEKGEDFLKELVELSVLRAAFSFGRYSWIPMCGRGSQCADLHIASEMAKATLEYIKMDYDRYNEDYTDGRSMEEYVEVTPFIHSILKRWNIE